MVLRSCYGLNKFGLDPYRGIQGAGRSGGFCCLVVVHSFFITGGDHDFLSKCLRSENAEKGAKKGFKKDAKKGFKKDAKEARQELLQELTRVFAGDKDAMEKIDKFFNGTTATGQK